MIQVLAATFQDGVFKPDERPALSDSARVRLVVEPINGDESQHRDEAWAAIQHTWETSHFDSGGDRLTRDQLHERRWHDFLAVFVGWQKAGR
jgi:predicted DNA-binding antitoxin AbrB/MazE fold protein